jgi:hypothetical protein
LKLHLDKRAGDLIDTAPDGDDDLLDSRELSRWLGVSITWIEQARHYGYGPAYPT